MPDINVLIGIDVSINNFDPFATNSAFHQIEFLAIWKMFQVPLIHEDGEYYQCQKLLFNEDGE